MKNAIQLLLILCIILVTCQTPDEQLELTSNGRLNIKSITTTYISHQSDTQEKDQKTVAVATFNPDGSLDQLIKYMSYPYNYSNPSERKFWHSPIEENIQHIMDGLHLGHAEKNILYGNNWPVSYAKMINETGHPKFEIRMGSEVFTDFKTNFEWKSSNIPSRIETKNTFEQFGKVMMYRYSEKFEYSKEGISKYSYTYLMSGEDIPKELSKGGYNVDFKYTGDLLSSVQEGNKLYQFIYEGQDLAKSEFYVNSKLMNHRIYHYNDYGLKVKTEIFNAYDQPEYTIEYHYEFY